MMTIAFMTHNMGKLNLKSFSEIVNSCLFTFFIHCLFISFRYTNNGKAYSESDYGSEYGMMDNGDGDAGRGLLKKLINIYYMFCETQPFVNIFQDIKFQHLEEEFHQNIHKATMDLRLTDQDIKIFYVLFFFNQKTPQVLFLKVGCNLPF